MRIWRVSLHGASSRHRNRSFANTGLGVDALGDGNVPEGWITRGIGQVGWAPAVPGIVGDEVEVLAVGGRDAE